jgi:hypothetical protein
MRNLMGFYCGMVDGNIGHLVTQKAELLTGYGHVLIETIDSCRDMHDLKYVSQICADRENSAEFLGTSLVVAGEALPRLVKKYKWFTGFDELWCFTARPVVPRPYGYSIVGPADLSETVPPGLLEWMGTSGCVLGLGDGLGLNYISCQKEVAEQIEGLFRK